MYQLDGHGALLLACALLPDLIQVKGANLQVFGEANKMIPKELTAIQAEDVQRLLQDNEPESITLEYKQELNPEQRVGILKTVCAFANTGTGDIVFGMEDENHYPRALPGIPEAEVEKTKLRIEQWVRSGIDPPSVTVRPWPVDLGDGKWAVIVRVERSWAGPHRVNEDGRFHRRHSAGHCEMTIEELRRAFTEAELLASGVRRFRDERVDLILGTDTPVRLKPGPKAVLHLISVASVRGGFQVDMHRAHKLLMEVDALGIPIDTRRYNLEGVVGTEGGTEQPSDGYLQVFRTGALEAVGWLNTEKPEELRNPVPGTNGAVKPPETRIVPALPAYLNLLERLGVPWPVYALVSLARVEGYQLWKVDGRNSYGLGRPLIPQTLTFPEVELPSDPVEAVRALRPTFDIFWQTFDEPRSLNFDKDDNYLQRSN